MNAISKAPGSVRTLIVGVLAVSLAGGLAIPSAHASYTFQNDGLNFTADLGQMSMGGSLATMQDALGFGVEFTSGFSGEGPGSSFNGLSYLYAGGGDNFTGSFGWQDLDPSTYQGTTSSFDHTYNFSLAEKSDWSFQLSACASCNSNWSHFLGDSNQDQLLISLYDTDSGQFLGKTSLKVGLDDVFASYSGLDAGRYSLVVSGVIGTENGYLCDITQGYQFGMVANPSAADVPLPGALVLLGTAVAGVGAFGARRRKAKA